MPQSRPDRASPPKNSSAGALAAEVVAAAAEEVLVEETCVVVSCEETSVVTAGVMEILEDVETSTLVVAVCLVIAVCETELAETLLGMTVC